MFIQPFLSVYMQKKSCLKNLSDAPFIIPEHKMYILMFQYTKLDFWLDTTLILQFYNFIL